MDETTTLNPGKIRTKTLIGGLILAICVMAFEYFRFDYVRGDFLRLLSDGFTVSGALICCGCFIASFTGSNEYKMRQKMRKKMTADIHKDDNVFTKKKKFDLNPTAEEIEEENALADSVEEAIRAIPPEVKAMQKKKLFSVLQGGFILLTVGGLLTIPYLLK